MQEVLDIVLVLDFQRGSAFAAMSKLARDLVETITNGEYGFDRILIGTATYPGSPGVKLDLSE
jgi:hypothetical protein